MRLRSPFILFSAVVVVCLTRNSVHPYDDETSEHIPKYDNEFDHVMMTSHFRHELYEALLTIQESVDHLSGRVRSFQRNTDELHEHMSSLQSSVTTLSAEMKHGMGILQLGMAALSRHIGESETNTNQVKETSTAEGVKNDELIAGGKIKAEATQHDLNSVQSSLNETNSTIGHLKLSPAGDSKITNMLEQCESQIKQVFTRVSGISNKLNEQELKVGNELKALQGLISDCMENQAAQMSETKSVMTEYDTHAQQMTSEFSEISNKLGQLEFQVSQVSAGVSGLSSKFLQELNQGKTDLKNLIQKQNAQNHLSQYNYQPIIRDCGGVFNIKIDIPIEIQYKLFLNYADYEFCVWSFVPDSPATSYEFQLEQGSFGSSHDGIVFYSWNGDGAITVTKQKAISHTIHGCYAFMTLSSESSATFPGFRIRVTARSSAGSPSTPVTYSAVSLSGSVGTYTHLNAAEPSHSRDISIQRASIVLQVVKRTDGSNKNRISYIASLNAELNHDCVYVFPLKSNRETKSGTINLTYLLDLAGVTLLKFPSPRGPRNIQFSTCLHLKGLTIEKALALRGPRVKFWDITFMCGLLDAR